MGDSRKWLLHLHGARALLAQLEEGLLQQTSVSVLVEIYNYLVCITSVTSDRTPARFGSQLQLPTTNSMLDIGIIHPLFGISSDLYVALGWINDLSARRYNNPSRGPGRSDEDIELELQSWTPPDVLNETRNFIEARAMGFAMRWAAIMRLQQVSRGLKNNDLQIRKASDNILSALSLIRPGSEMEAHMLFPLFMAGVGSMTKPNRLTVEYRLDAMATTIGFGNISMAHRLLDEMWRRSNQEEIVNWEELLHTKYQGLVLF
jgi:transcriptional activator protein UGA3